MRILRELKALQAKNMIMLEKRIKRNSVLNSIIFLRTSKFLIQFILKSLRKIAFKKGLSTSYFQFICEVRVGQCLGFLGTCARARLRFNRDFLTFLLFSVFFSFFAHDIVIY